MLTIKVEPTAGSHISKTFKEAIELAQKTNCYIEFDFNEVKCIASPQGIWEKGEEMYHDAIKSKDKYKFALT